MSTPLEPGFIPEGWARGDPIHIINKDFSAGQIAAVMHKPIDIWRVIDVHGGPMAGTIQFHYAEQVKVRAWLNWWQGEAE